MLFSIDVPASVLCFLCVIVTFHGNYDRNCDELGVTLYDTFGCKVKSHDNDGCPSDYECNFPKDNATCYFDGKTYSVGEKVIPHSAPCNAECTCRITPEGASFTCNCARCNLNGMQDEDIKPGCYRFYEPGECCPSGVKWHGKDKIHKCTVDGKEYDEGTGYDVKDKCQHCTCTKEGIVCYPTPCAEWAQLYLWREIRNYCAPVYLKDGSYPEGLKCCTHQFYCPKGTEVIEQGDQPNPEGKVGQFGDQKVNLGDHFNATAGYPPFFVWHLNCICELPPFVTCSETYKSMNETIFSGRDK